MAPDSPIRWGILSTANIGVAKVIPAIQASSSSRVVAIASRDPSRAESWATKLAIPKWYGSYDELLADPDVDAIYNPLPNHLHVPLSTQAADAGKHVLCEKPIALTADDAKQLLAARDRNRVQIAEAFMVRTHPQWHTVIDLIAQGRIGELRLVSGHFSYYRRDPNDVRSRVEWGGGVLLDVGCYPITISRWLFGAEPTAVVGQIERDPDLGVDRLVSAVLRFPNGQATFSCAGQLVPYQRMHIFGTTGRVEVEIPFNAPADRPCRIYVDDGSRFADASAEAIEFPPVNQYTLQADCFVDAIRGRGAVPVSVENAIANMTVIDAIFRSAESGRWEVPSF